MRAVPMSMAGGGVMQGISRVVASAIKRVRAQNCPAWKFGQRDVLNGEDTASATPTLRTTFNPKRVQAESSRVIGLAGADHAEFARAKSLAAMVGLCSRMVGN